MKEFITTLEPLKKGLNPIKDRDSSFLVNGYNMRIGEKGAESIDFDMPSYITSEVLFNAGIEVNETFPQVFLVNDEYLLLTSTKLYRITSSSIVEIVLYDAYSESATTAIENGKWSCASIGSTVYFVNGKSAIYYQEVLEGTATWKVENTIHIECTEEYMGHIMTAGFDGTYYNDEWLDYFSASQSSVAQVRFLMDKNTLTWGSVNAGDLLWLYYPEQAFTGPLGFSTEYQFYKEWIFRNDSGHMNIPSLDGIKAIKKSGDLLFVYGTKRSAICQFTLDPVFSLGIIGYLNYGLQSKSAIAGNETTHFIIDNKNNLRKIVNGQIEKIGFPKYFDSDLYSLEYHEKYDEVYINGTNSYVYNKGLMNLSYMIPSAFSFENTEYLIYK